jgi:DNA-binding GntR family transcriptional regulator
VRSRLDRFVLRTYRQLSDNLHAFVGGKAMPSPSPRRLSARVRAYEAIVQRIRDGALPPGSALPSEPDLAVLLGVSRPALREALILLQEDGVISVQQGVGRRVSDRPVRQGYERVGPIEDALAAGRMRVTTVEKAVENELTDFTAQHLLIGPAARLRFWESLIEADGMPACLAQEWATDEDVLAKVGPGLPERLDLAGRRPGTMVAALREAGPGLRLHASSTVVASVLGGRRGELLRRDAETPVVLLTRTVLVGDVPVLVGKYVLPSGAPAVRVFHR